MAAEHFDKGIRTGMPPAGPGSRRAVIAATIGNLLETYDFAVYGFFAITISKLFFPAENDTAALLLTVGTFGVGFFMRPIGAVILGSMADHKGRKFTLSVTILLMALGTAMIGLAPTYDSIGLWAPAIIVVARLIQGFSAGGEIGTATAFMVEHAPAGRRGLFASFQQASQACALLLGSLVGVAVTGLLSQEALESWGWRVPFLLGLLIGPVGFYIRAKTGETGEFIQAASQRKESALSEALRLHKRSIVIGFGITVTWTVCTYFFLVYMPTYAVRELALPQSTAFLANSISLAIILVLAPMFGALSDRIGRRPLLLWPAIAIALLTYPLLAFLTGSPGTGSLIAFQAIFAVLIAAFTGTAPSAIAEICPPAVRSTGTSIAYNLAVTIFGGFAPFIATWLIASTGSSLSPAAYVTAAVTLGTTLVFLLHPARLETAARVEASGTALFSRMTRR
ncbi:MFS transporter [Rhodoligotrophos defluvii]|uniref:MFS transporter n=1 Tax=Rhodoligotrophos defluvii TaxID=2561934 RepID=UPI0010C9E082|nr:MFS transporter [Rhodoligotrophos defluvii]